MLDKFKGHTPGPWKVNGANVVGPKEGWFTASHHIAVFSPMPCDPHDPYGNEERSANAALASAAPDLLAETIRLRELLAEVRNFVGCKETNGHTPDCIFLKIDAAPKGEQ